MELRGLGRADFVEFQAQDAQRFFKVADFKHQQMLERVDGLGIDLPKMVRIDARLFVTQHGPQGIDVFRADLFGRKRGTEREADFVHGRKEFMI